MPRGVGPVGTGVVEGEGGGGGVDEQEQSCGEEGRWPHGGGGGGEGAGDGEAWGVRSRVAGIGDDGEAEAAGSVLGGCSAMIYIDIECGAGDCKYPKRSNCDHFRASIRKADHGRARTTPKWQRRIR